MPEEGYQRQDGHRRYFAYYHCIQSWRNLQKASKIYSTFMGKHSLEMILLASTHVFLDHADQLLIGKEVARQLGMGPHMYTTDVLLKV